MRPCPWCQKLEASPRCVGMHERIPGIPLFQIACACGARGPVHTSAEASEEAWDSWGAELVSALDELVGHLPLATAEERRIESHALAVLRRTRGQEH